jgi:hypothetical protein
MKIADSLLVKPSNRNNFFSLLTAITVVSCLIPSIKLAYGGNINGDLDIFTEETDQYRFNNSNLTLTIKEGGSVIRNNNSPVNVRAKPGATIIIESGATVATKKDGTKDNAISASTVLGVGAVDTTITNSGIISSENDNGILIDSSTNGIITNNAGGIITAVNNCGICADTSQNLTITNSGTISAASNTISASGSSGLTITNSGTISVGSPSSTAIDLGNATGATILLKKGSLIIGKISTTATGNKLQLDHGFGQAYFYETTGDFDLQDLSGNTVVKGSAGSVGQGANETVAWAAVL